MNNAWKHPDRGLKQEAASSGVKEVDYGSSQANAAVKKLEKLGAIVYPPGEKGAVDWGLLAGLPYPLSCFVSNTETMLSSKFYVTSSM